MSAGGWSVTYSISPLRSSRATSSSLACGFPSLLLSILFDPWCQTLCQFPESYRGRWSLTQASLRIFIILLVLTLGNISSNAHISIDVAELATVYLSQTDIMSPLNIKCEVKLGYAWPSLAYTCWNESTRSLRIWTIWFLYALTWRLDFYLLFINNFANVSFPVVLSNLKGITQDTW